MGTGKNKSKLFYEHFGAKEIDSVKIEIMDKGLNELAYGWKDITKLTFQ